MGNHTFNDLILFAFISISIVIFFIIVRFIFFYELKYRKVKKYRIVEYYCELDSDFRYKIEALVGNKWHPFSSSYYKNYQSYNFISAARCEAYINEYLEDMKKQQRGDKIISVKNVENKNVPYEEPMEYFITD